jgi:KUP system potassium uptake protein
LTASADVAPGILLHHFKHYKVLHERVLLLTVITEGVPEVPASKRVDVVELSQGFVGVTAHYGFMETPDIPEVLKACRRFGIDPLPATVSYVLGRNTVLPTGRAAMARWRKGLFAFLSRNARPAGSFFQLPPNRVIELGAQLEL